MPPDAAKLGKRIRRLRVDLSLSQKELAQLAGVHLNQVHAWETGRHVPGLRARKPLATALKIEPEILYYEGTERDAVIAEAATNVMVRVTRDAAATLTQRLSAARGLVKKPAGGEDAASRQLAEFRQMMEEADKDLTRILAEIDADERATGA